MDNNPTPPLETPDAPDKEKMDQIRRRRLEKLGGPSSAAPKTEGAASNTIPAPDSESSTSTTQVEATKPKINITKAPIPPPAASDNPFTKLTARPASGNSSSAVSTQPATNPLKRPAQAEIQTTPRATPVPTKVETIEEYENKTLSHIFRITLNPNEKHDPANHRLIYLPGLRQELEEENAPLMLTKDRLDTAILEAASTVPHNKSVLEYLLPCWKRVMKALKGLRGYASAKDEILKEAKRLCMSNCIFASEVPEIFGREPNAATDTLAPYLVIDPTEDMGVGMDFLVELNLRIDEDESVTSMVTKAAADMSSQLSRMTMNDDYKQYINGMKLLCSFSSFVKAISQHPSFLTEVPAEEIEKATILGAFFRISPLQPDVTKVYFDAPRTMGDRHIKTSQESLRLTLQNHQRDLLDIINHFIKSGPQSRNKTLDWFAYIVNSNHKRRALRPDSLKLSTDGFLINVTVVLDGLCEPFIDPQFSKVDRIDVNYLRRHPRVDIKEETKLNADQSASDEYYQVEESGSSNFISEVFFLTLAAHHYGSEATNSQLKTLEKDIKYIKEKIAQMELERAKFINSPPMMARFEEQFKRFNDVLDKSSSLKLAIEGVVFDKTMQAKALMFMRVVTVWLLRIATSSDYTPQKTISLPLSDELPDAFKFLPEYVLEDIVGNLNFIFRFVPDVTISGGLGDEIIALAITFLTNSEYIKNPYLKAKLVTLLFHGTWPVYHMSKGVLGDSLSGSRFANDHLLHALMKFYIEVESTGAHTQFYDKFNIRYEIFQVIKCIWTNQIYQQRLTQESKINTDFFLRFVNLLLNDATYVLDEALTKFPKIHDLQAELKTSKTLTAADRQTKEEELARAEDQAQSYMQLTNETISMMKLFTKTLSGSFTMPEIVDRVAAMLNYTLDTIAGPKSVNLRVDDPQKYKFEPRKLLSEFVEIYLNLGVSENFVMAVARDGRSYKPSNFDYASRIVQRFALKSPDELSEWENLKNRFKTAKEQDDQDEEDYNDAPEEYLDPIMATLMLDPVILPTSRTTVDRSTIRSHLLSDPHDPFNRAPLSIDDVVDDIELREKINAWREEAKAKAKSARLGGSSADKMDTTAG